MYELTREKIIELLSAPACDLCPFDAACPGGSDCEVQRQAAKMLADDLTFVRIKNTQQRKEKRRKKKAKAVQPSRRKPTAITFRAKGREIKVYIHGFMPWNMGHFLAARLRADLPVNVYKHCWFCGHNFDLAEVPVGITVVGIGNRFACDKCKAALEIERAGGEKHG